MITGMWILKVVELFSKSKLADKKSIHIEGSKDPNDKVQKRIFYLDAQTLLQPFGNI